MSKLNWENFLNFWHSPAHFNLIKVLSHPPSSHFSSSAIVRMIIWLSWYHKCSLYLQLISHSKRLWGGRKWRQRWEISVSARNSFQIHKTFTIFSFSLFLSSMLSFNIIDAQWSRVNEWKFVWCEFCDYN